MYTDQFNTTIDIWLNALEGYDFKALSVKSDQGSWSLGQVYMHLIEETRWYMEQMEASLVSDENSEGVMTESAKITFQNHEFANERVKGDPFISDNVPQPKSKEELLASFQKLKIDMNELGKRITTGSSRGKAKHPGLGYFSSEEWFTYTEMHMRHHLRQKGRIDKDLK